MTDAELARPGGGRAAADQQPQSAHHWHRYRIEDCQQALEAVKAVITPAA